MRGRLLSHLADMRDVRTARLKSTLERHRLLAAGRLAREGQQLTPGAHWPRGDDLPAVHRRRD
jgi:hypothetical protein